MPASAEFDALSVIVAPLGESVERKIMCLAVTVFRITLRENESMR